MERKGRGKEKGGKGRRGEGEKEGREEGPVKSVKPRARKVANPPLYF